jgi:hypothetical protein
MICEHCNSAEFNEGTLKLKNGNIQVLIYCTGCGQIMSRKELRPMPEPKARKSWAERQAAASTREQFTNATKLTWKERKARKGLHSNQTQTELPTVQSQLVDDSATPF